MSDDGTKKEKSLRKALGTFATGVTVVTTIDGDGEPRGFTANSFTSVSLEPPLILVCLAREAASCEAFSKSGHFCVNVLAEDQQDVCALFASPVDDRFEKTNWHAAQNGSPIIDDVISWFACSTHDIVDGGDHIILIGHVTAHDFSSRSPLIYCSGSYVEFSLLQRAMEAASSDTSTRISAVINCGGSLPMRRDPTDGKLSLPQADRLGNKDDRESLAGKLAANGISVAMPFVCAVYEDAATSTHNVVYRGSAEACDAGSVRDFEMIPLENIPWDELVDNALRMLLERYINESEHDAFGVYVGDMEQGQVHAIGRNR